MGNKAFTELQNFFANRRALLWVCQRYDLMVDEAPHEYDLPETEASMRYRKELNATDEKLCSFYWEAIWLEGVRSPICHQSEKAGASGSARFPKNGCSRIRGRYQSKRKLRGVPAGVFASRSCRSKHQCAEWKSIRPIEKSK